MKSRRVIVSFEVETDAHIEDLRHAREVNFYAGTDGTLIAWLRLVEAPKFNVIRAKPKAAAPKRKKGK